METNHRPDDASRASALSYLAAAEQTARDIPGISTVTPQTIRTAAVIGAGQMGGGIAMCFANAGIPVKLIDVTTEATSAGIARIQTSYQRSVERGKMTAEQLQQRMALISADTRYESLADADIVIEAVFEKMALKKTIFAQLDQCTRADCILGSNTSSLDIDAIASTTQHPQRVIGTHFFSPANVMKLMENVRGTATSPQTIATVMNLAQRLGKIAVLAGNCDGFIGNRMMQYYLGRAEFLLEEGCSPEQIDHVAETFGMPMGPCAMRDLTGIDIAMLVRAERQKLLPPEERFSPILNRMAERGWLGQKSGKGFYVYAGREKTLNPEVSALIAEVSATLGIERRTWTDEEIRAHLFHPLINEGAKILEEHIAIRASDIDVVWANGYGFPKDRGGPMYWANEIGLDKVLRTAQVLGEKHGPRWQPAALLNELVAKGRTFSDSHS